jgi:hypothetical protein
MLSLSKSPNAQLKIFEGDFLLPKLLKKSQGLQYQLTRSLRRGFPRPASERIRGAVGGDPREASRVRTHDRIMTHDTRSPLVLGS